MRRRVVVLVTAFGLLLAQPLAVSAQESLSVTTGYPSITVDPGGTARFPLTITTDTPGRVDLAVVSLPEGWTARLRGGGSTVEAVYTSSEEPPEVSLEVDVPTDAPPGTAQVVLEARSGALTQRLPLDLRIVEREAGAVSLTAEFPALRGPSDVAYRFDLELGNGTSQETTFSLETQAPAGWRIDARPTGEERAATAVVEAGGTARIQVDVTPPLGVPAGRYLLLVRAVGGPEPAETQLGIEITGTPDVRLDTADQRLNARVTAGGSTVITLIVTNSGSAPLNDLTLSGTPPRDWEVTFEPATIAELAPGDSVNVDGTLSAASNAIAGDYTVDIRVGSEEVQDELELRATVETSPLGGLLGLGLLGVVAVGLFAVFRRYGRR